MAKVGERQTTKAETYETKAHFEISVLLNRYSSFDILTFLRMRPLTEPPHPKSLGTTAQIKHSHTISILLVLCLQKIVPKGLESAHQQSELNYTDLQ